jgi:hypothetical protein
MITYNYNIQNTAVFLLFFIFNLKNYEKMFNIKIVWFIIMHDVQQKCQISIAFLILHFYT